jgi:hypothetical protein
LRKGDCSVVLLEYLRRYHLEVESLYYVPQDLWGYAERTIRGSSTTLSNHASGTAVDCRAVRHGLGMTGTFTAAETRALDRILDDLDVIRHGKDYVGRKDPMHAELVGTPAEIKAVADDIRSATSLTSVTAKDWFSMATEDDLRSAIRAELGRVIFETTGSLPNRRGPGGAELPGAGADSLFGYSINADGMGFRLEQAMARVEAAVRGEDAPVPISITDVPTPELLAELSRRFTSGALS